MLARLSEFKAARQTVGPLLSTAYPVEIRDTARSLMGYVLRLESGDQLRAEASGPLAPSTSAATQPATPPSAPSDDELKP